MLHAGFLLSFRFHLHLRLLCLPNQVCFGSLKLLRQFVSQPDFIIELIEVTIDPYVANTAGKHVE